MSRPRLTRLDWVLVFAGPTAVLIVAGAALWWTA